VITGRVRTWRSKQSSVRLALGKEWGDSMYRGTAQSEGILLAYVLCIASALALVLRPAAIKVFHRPASRESAHERFEAGLALVMGYGFFAAAALIAKARVPDFFHEHLLDGLALAALVGLLVKMFPRDRPGEALPWIRRPCWILVLFAVGGAAVFGVIGAAGAFEAGGGWLLFFTAAGGCALFGAFIFPYTYWLTVTLSDAYSGWTAWLTWWFHKRPENAAGPEPAPVAEPGPAAAEPVPAVSASGSQPKESAKSSSR
jgi:hypothetical protein